MIEGGFAFSEISDLDQDHPQFTLTLISTNGPISSVAWHRNGVPLNKAANATSILNDAVSARYTHTLTVSERLGELYSVALSNQKPSHKYRTFYVKGKK